MQAAPWRDCLVLPHPVCTMAVFTSELGMKEAEHRERMEAPLGMMKQTSHEDESGNTFPVSALKLFLF